MIPRPFEIVQELEHLQPGDVDEAIAVLTEVFRRKARVVSDSVRKMRQNLVLFRDRHKTPEMDAKDASEESVELEVEVIEGELGESYAGYAFDQDEETRPAETVLPDRHLVRERSGTLRGSQALRGSAQRTLRGSSRLKLDDSVSASN